VTFATRPLARLGRGIINMPNAISSDRPQEDTSDLRARLSRLGELLAVLAALALVAGLGGLVVA
jgi:hypothetical protein